MQSAYSALSTFEFFQITPDPLTLPLCRLTPSLRRHVKASPFICRFVPSVILSLGSYCSTSPNIQSRTTGSDWSTERPASRQPRMEIANLRVSLRLHKFRAQTFLLQECKIKLNSNNNMSWRQSSLSIRLFDTAKLQMPLEQLGIFTRVFPPVSFPGLLNFQYAPVFSFPLGDQVRMLQNQHLGRFLFQS